MATQYKFYSYQSTANYKKYDVINGISTPTENRLYYATQDSVGQSPDAYYSYNVVRWERTDEQATVYFTKTGNGPDFAPGSLIKVINLSDAAMDYTGMAIEGDGTGVKFTIAGWDKTSNTVAGTVQTVLNPAWTTGFLFVPSYSTALDIKTNILEAKFGEGYSQRMRSSINSNDAEWNLSFENRSNKEAKAILAFVEDKGGVEPFDLLLPISNIVNNAKLKYIAIDPKLNTTAFNINTVNVTVKQVFDL